MGLESDGVGGGIRKTVEGWWLSEEQGMEWHAFSSLVNPWHPAGRRRGCRIGVGASTGER